MQLASCMLLDAVPLDFVCGAAVTVYSLQRVRSVSAGACYWSSNQAPHNAGVLIAVLLALTMLSHQY
jgi:hypothetical protein